MSEKPAVLGGKPTFDETLPIVRPPLKTVIEKSLRDYRRILESGMITSYSYVGRLEKAVAEFVGVNHCVAVANCTSALILTIRALKVKNGEALIPSFTFPATAHAAFWSNLKIKLVDCDAKTFNMSVEDLQEKVTKQSKVIVPVHVFGNPCDVRAIGEIAEDNGVRVVYDAAHAFGATKNDIYIGGFGDAEVFSGSPTKAFTTVEGGLVTTNNTKIAERVRIGRNYGHHGDYNCEMAGLSARMSELHAALGLNLLPLVSSNIERRNKIAEIYKKGLGKLSGVGFQEVSADSKSAYKDFAITIDEDEFGLNRDELVACLEKENIMTRRYFYPPIHMQSCYPELRAEGETLPNTTFVSERVVCLPMFSDLADEQVKRVVNAVTKIHEHAGEIKSEFRRKNR